MKLRPRRRGIELVLGLLSASCLASPARAWACAVCGAADRALPASGNEVPFEGRRRATLEGRGAAFASTTSALTVTELRTQPGLSVAANATTMLAADVPLLRRATVARGDAALAPVETSRWMLGDVELRAAHTAARSATRRLTLGGGVKLPSAPLERDGLGRALPPDLQPGCGAIAPFVSATAAWSSSLVSAWTSAMLLLPVSVRDGPHPGDSLRASATLQLQPGQAFAARVSTLGRLDGTGGFDGEVVKRSGGAAFHLATELVTSPTSDLVISVGASFPVVQAMRGYRATSPVLLASLGWDF